MENNKSYSSNFIDKLAKKVVITSPETDKISALEKKMDQIQGVGPKYIDLAKVQIPNKVVDYTICEIEKVLNNALGKIDIVCRKEIIINHYNDTVKRTINNFFARFEKGDRPEAYIELNKRLKNLCLGKSVEAKNLNYESKVNAFGIINDTIEIWREKTEKKQRGKYVGFIDDAENFVTKQNATCLNIVDYTKTNFDEKNRVLKNEYSVDARANKKGILGFFTK